MTVIDAIRSGKPFRRPTWTHANWLVVHKNPLSSAYGGGELIALYGGHIYPLQYLDDLLADDWIVMESDDENIS